MRLTVARIGRAHGIRGEVTVELRTDAPQRRFAPGARLFVVPSDRAPAGQRLPDELVVASARDHNGVLLVAFEAVADRNHAESLRDAWLEAEILDEDPEPDAWYDHELVGLRAVGPLGQVWGELAAVEHTGAQDRLVVRRPDGQERLVPFVRAIVVTVDVAGGLVVIDPPGGLLDDVEPTGGG